MIKAHLAIFLLVLIFFLASVSNVLAIMSHRITYYVALVLLVVVLTITYVVLRKHTNKRIKNEEDDK